MNGDILKQGWYVLLTRSRFENVVYEGLVKKSIEVFLPRVLVQSRRRDRKKMIRAPLFPGYVFVRSNLVATHHLEIVKTTGAVRLIGNKDRPLPVADNVLESLRIMVGTDESLITGTQFQAGDRVIVTQGPFAGVIGVFNRYQGQNRVIVNIEILGQFAAAEVDEADVEKLPPILS